jgi:putative transposase
MPSQSSIQIGSVDMESYKFHSDGALFYLTFSIIDWLPVFVSADACQIVVGSLNFCHAQKGLRINAFVIMPTHLHLICFDERFDASSLETTITEFRKFTGRRIADFCARHMPACFNEAFRAAAGADRNRRIWQPSRHPVQIETEGFWQTKFDYLHDNPRRKGLVTRAEHWRFSSASFWSGDGLVSGEVPLSVIQW